MRVAICISGFLRGWTSNRESFEKVFCRGLDMSKVDIFVQTYHQNYHETSSGRADEHYTTAEIEAMFEGLPVKVMAIEDRTESFVDRTIVTPSLIYSEVKNFMTMHPESSDKDTVKIPLGSRIYDQLRVIEAANDLRRAYEKENNVAYDLVVKTRFDVYYHSAKWNLEMLADGKIHTELGTTGGHPQDCVCVCTPEVMDKCYAHRFVLLDDIFFSTLTGQGAEFCAHFTIRAAMKHTKVEFGSPVCVASVRRDEDLFHVPGHGNKSLEETKHILRNRFEGFDI